MGLPSSDITKFANSHLTQASPLEQCIRTTVRSDIVTVINVSNCVSVLIVNVLRIHAVLTKPNSVDNTSTNTIHQKGAVLTTGCP